MTLSYDKRTAVVLLPAIAGGRFLDGSLSAWLARADLAPASPPLDSLAAVLSSFGEAPPASGRAALRMWGQTGDRPTSWIAAADPVYLEPRLDHLCLFAQHEPEFTRSEFRQLIDHLQDTLGSASGPGFVRLGLHGYVTANSPFATAALPAQLIDGRVPNEFLPVGDGEDAHRRLVSEIEMALHDHPVNVARQSAGRRPVNSLWLWGGGFLPEFEPLPRPPLFGDDAQLTGYWLARSARAEPWPGSIDDCLAATDDGFVAVVPDAGDDRDDVLQASLGSLRSALESRRLAALELVFLDGLRARLCRSHALRFWRRRSALSVDRAVR